MKKGSFHFGIVLEPSILGPLALLSSLLHYILSTSLVFWQVLPQAGMSANTANRHVIYILSTQYEMYIFIMYSIK